MNVRERFHAALDFEKVDRMPLVEWAAWWDLTFARWKREGLPADLDFDDAQKYFGLDLMFAIWASPKSPSYPVDAEGNGLKVASADDYRRLRRAKAVHDLDAVDFSRYERHRDAHRNGDAICRLVLDGFFWFPRTLFGIEEHLYSFYDSPELMKEMNRDHADFCLRVLEKFFSLGYEADFMSFAEDLSYNNGPMLSKEQFEEFVAPYYQKILPLLKEHKVRIFIDSDGDISECVNWFLEAGMEGIFPLERRAGVDVARLRREHPKLLMLGGFDKTVMDCGKDAVKAEFERLLPVMRQGGFVVSCDHQTPPLVSLSQYMEYVELFRHYAALAAK